MAEGEKAPIGLILLLWGAGLGAATQFAKISVSFADLQTQYPGADLLVGWLLSLISLVGIFLGLTAGQLVSTVGFRRMLIWALLLGAAVSLFQATLPGIEVFLVSRVLEGLSHLTIVVAAPTLLALITPERHRYLSMTLWSTFFGVSYALVSLIGPPIIAVLGLGGLYALHAVYMLAIAGILFGRLPKGLTQQQPFPSFKAILSRHLRAYTSAREFAPGLGWLFYTLTFVAVLTVMPATMSPREQLVLVPLMPIASILSSFTLSAYLLRRINAVTVIQIGFAMGFVVILLAVLFEVGGAIYLLLFAALGLVQSASFAAIPLLNEGAEAQALANGAMAQMGNLGNTLGTPVMLAMLFSFGEVGVDALLLLCYALGVFVHWFLARRRAA